ncbi:hypothetical protein, partial [Xenorhabdus sp. KK7.4]|uniref:hypothetical protein n=1 Tax=Xenorhabdus sp. KK7.4 TaxID=1851572 RepID=UPI0019D4D5F8
AATAQNIKKIALLVAALCWFYLRCFRVFNGARNPILCRKRIGWGGSRKNRKMRIDDEGNKPCYFQRGLSAV